MTALRLLTRADTDPRLSEDDIYALKHLYPLKNTRADTNSSLSKQKRRDVRQKNKKNFVKKLKTVANTPPLKSGGLKRKGRKEEVLVNVASPQKFGFQHFGFPQEYYFSVFSKFISIGFIAVVIQIAAPQNFMINLYLLSGI
ncbi:hypothetical protein RhiirA5_370404 [Rhizophagus irregularis]|uniref:Uncharacterized protein n=1 Tax=Rhizophagus irregularis TaxID=588596 RepID=A0A2I1ETF2_9GLOM|nr:hypothetical protein RhiirA5_370404 [Rhizophagus irregularis]PKC62951.1 hypothetical protein RhiirA1_397221 [Rhizophagus irregularis]PKY25390.1 hypothetical protein RhiirB3_388722 [Rhizophagus irregularis]